jgi:hypothetical protein
VWIALHAVSADMTILLLMTHFALHAKWFARVFGAQIVQPAPAVRTAQGPRR